MDFYGFANDAGMMQQVQLDLIDADPKQPRRHFDEAGLAGLAASMENSTLLEPIVVYREGDRYRLLVGERRLRAARLNGWAVIDARVVDKPAHPLLEQLMENIQRQDLLPWEVMLTLEALLGEGLAVGEIAAATGMSKRHVRRYQQIINRPDMRDRLLAGESLRDVLDGMKESRGGNDAPEADIPTAPVADFEPVSDSNGGDGRTETEAAPSASTSPGVAPVQSPKPPDTDGGLSPASKDIAIEPADGSLGPSHEDAKESSSRAPVASVALPGQVETAIGVITGFWSSMSYAQQVACQNRLKRFIAGPSSQGGQR